MKKEYKNCGLSFNSPRAEPVFYRFQSAKEEFEKLMGKPIYAHEFITFLLDSYDNGKQKFEIDNPGVLEQIFQKTEQ
jgi:hypothetical protein